MPEHRAIRVLTFPEEHVERKDQFLSRVGDELVLDVPGGRVTLRLNGGWSESGTAFCHLVYQTEAEVDLERRLDQQQRIRATLASIEDVPDEVLAPIREFADALVTDEEKGPAW